MVCLRIVIFTTPGSGCHQAGIEQSSRVMKRKEAPSQTAPPHLAERIDQLSIKRQEIIRPILEHPREYVLLSVRAMAARLHTDPATIVRIVRGLGFGSYREFQRHLHELSLAYATSLDTMQSGSRDVSMP